MPRSRRAPTLSRDAFTKLFDALPEGVYIGLIGTDEDATLAANPHARTMFGHPEDAPVAAMRPFEPDRFVDEQARGDLVERLRQDGHLAGHLLRLRRDDGTAMWVEVTARAEPVRASTALRVEAILRDVTARRRVEDEAREVHQQLAQTEKLAALGQTMSGVAHELNNPLATILACAERLDSRRLDALSRREINAIHNAAERAARIVRNLQTFARKRHTTRTTVDLNDIVRDTLAVLDFGRTTAQKVIVADLGEALPAVFADQHQIQQILLNLIRNAEQATHDRPAQGSVTVRTRADPDQDTVLVAVEDNGPGISDDIRARIFDPFFTTKAVGTGTGLGLTVAYAIAEEHGGQLSVTSEPGAGATFCLTLPSSSGLARVRKPPASTQPVGTVPKGTRALVIEDEDALGEAVAAALADEGFRVDRADDGVDGLARLREQHYDVIVCDLKMPRLDGVGFFAEASARMPQIARRMIFVTGDVAGTDAERFLASSGCRWVAKPFRLRDLVRAARETLG